jgi:hypothetical protein
VGVRQSDLGLGIGLVVAFAHGFAPLNREIDHGGGGNQQASQRGVIGEGEHGRAGLDTAGNSPMNPYRR